MLIIIAYYASTYKRERILLHHETKLNQIQQKISMHPQLKTHITQNKKKTKKLNPGLVTSNDLQPRNGVGLFW